ncbi:MAG: twin-arginine translocation signal domain-containing protein, partial [Opitutales bacterium]|nr:twin-arginine translocation signal domain-containing protein [Opitutales bacterium]
MEYTRRDFLKLAGLAGGGLMMSSGVARAQDAKIAPSEEINLAMVGLGAEGNVLLDSLLKIPGVRFRAICDIWKTQRVRARGRILGMTTKLGKKTDLKDHMYEDYKD